MPVVMISGGLDSITLMHWLVKEPEVLGVLRPKEPLIAMHFSTGIAMDNQAAAFCKHHCALLGVELFKRDVCFWDPGTRARGKPPKKKEPAILARKPDDPYWAEEYDYQDGRGIFFLTHVCLFASKRGIRQVYLAHQLEWLDPPPATPADTLLQDTGPEFVDAFVNLMYSGGFFPPRIPEVRTPFIETHMSKRHIAALARRLKVDVEKTVSCEFSYPPCGKCTQCSRRFEALSSAGFPKGVLKK